MTIRQDLLATLESYQTCWGRTHLTPAYRGSPDPEGIAARFISFVSGNPQCFSRASLDGHLTGSALVVNSSLTKVLLTHHKKLGMWLQLGGHADGHHLLHEVAMTEAHEESGLKDLNFLNYEWDLFTAKTPRPLPFDLDYHLIPANSKDAEHLHYDVRYLVVAESESKPMVSDESHDVRWFTLPDARKVTQELSMHRQFDKVEWLKTALRV